MPTFPATHLHANSDDLVDFGATVTSRHSTAEFGARSFGPLRTTAASLSSQSRKSVISPAPTTKKESIGNTLDTTDPRFPFSASTTFRSQPEPSSIKMGGISAKRRRANEKLWAFMVRGLWTLNGRMVLACNGSEYLSVQGFLFGHFHIFTPCDSQENSPHHAHAPTCLCHRM